MNYRIILSIMFLIIITPAALAIKNTGHINLLAVSGDGENETGSVADLYLEIKPGSGRVFLDTYPLTKVDTQFATRFAQKIACEYTEKNCDRYDFFYTIRSRSAIVGGPSAGAATTLLTIMMLEDEELPQDIAVTGTINAGGLIGPVAGVKAKVDAAEDNGLSKVLIPRIYVGNKTEIDSFLDNISIDVVRVGNIDDAMFEITGKKKGIQRDIDVNPQFISVMREIASIMCNSTEKLIVNGTNTTEESRGSELYKRGINATANGAYYSSASFCFGANVQFRRLDLDNKTNPELLIVYADIKEDLENLENNVDNINLTTIDDLQTYMIVKERIKDAKKYIDDVEAESDYANLSSVELAYSIERYNSALSWSNFFGTGKKEYDLNAEALSKACIDKISEVESYLEYISIYLDFPLKNTEDDLNDAKVNLINEDFALCISTASKAKAEAELVLEALSVSHSQMKELVDEKLNIAKQSIIREQERSVFPILGYSYFEYANTLKEYDPDSALVYASYSIEFSNLDSYFEKKRGFNVDIDYKSFGIFVLGAVFGMVLTILSFKAKSKKRR